MLVALREALPGLKAVEMEGAAVAQVAEQEGIPGLVLRVISDGADANAAQSFGDFIQVYDRRAWCLLQELLSRAEQSPERGTNRSCCGGWGARGAGGRWQAALQRECLGGAAGW